MVITLLAKLYGGIYALIIPMGLIVLWIAVRIIFPIKRKVTRGKRYSARIETPVVRLDDMEHSISD